MTTSVSKTTTAKSEKTMKLIKELVTKNVANPTVCCIHVIAD
jgi:hypothetical protein